MPSLGTVLQNHLHDGSVSPELETQIPTDIQSVTGDSGHEKCAPKKLDHTVKSFLELIIQQSPLPGQAYKDQKSLPLCDLTRMLFSRHGLPEKAKNRGHREASARPEYLFGLRVSEGGSFHQGCRVRPAEEWAFAYWASQPDSLWRHLTPE